MLGFRDEIRTAETAQARALAKILKLVGGEVDPVPVVDTPTAQPTTQSAGGQVETGDGDAG